MKKLLSISLISSIMFLGCGGSSSSSNNNITIKPLPINSDTISKIVNAVSESASSSNQAARTTSNSSSSLNSISEENNPHFVSFNRNLALEIISKIKKQNTLNATVNDEINCSEGGKVIITGTFDDTTKNSELTQEFQQCKEFGTTQNGIIKVNLYNYDNNLSFYRNTDIKYLTDFTVCTSENICAKILKDSEDNLEIYRVHSDNNVTWIDSFKFKTTQKQQVGTQIAGEENSIYNIDTNNTTNILSMYPLQGRLIFDNYYLDYDTEHDMSSTPLEVNLTNRETLSGTFYFKSGTTKLKIVFDRNNSTAYIDKDGDGTYEETIPVPIQR